MSNLSFDFTGRTTVAARGIGHEPAPHPHAARAAVCLVAPDVVVPVDGGMPM